MAADNKTIGKFHLDGIPPAMRGTPQIEVTFDLDANGILKVSAKDLGTGKEQKITITASSGLSKDEVERLVKDAEAHASEDSAKRDAVDAHNRGESMAYETEKFLKENGEKMPSDKKMKVENSLQALKEALKGSDTDAVKKAVETLTADMQAVSADLYAQAKQAQGGQAAGAGAPPPPPPGGNAKNNGDVMDADFEMVDDDKK
jgi:molecular chaperone DnaK